MPRRQTASNPIIAGPPSATETLVSRRGKTFQDAAQAPARRSLRPINPVPQAHNRETDPGHIDPILLRDRRRAGQIPIETDRNRITPLPAISCLGASPTPANRSAQFKRQPRRPRNLHIKRHSRRLSSSRFMAKNVTVPRCVWMAGKVTERPSNRGQTAKTRPSDGDWKTRLPLGVA